MSGRKPDRISQVKIDFLVEDLTDFCVCVCFQAVGKREEILSFKANQAAVRPRALLLLPSRKAFALRSNF